MSLETETTPLGKLIPLTEDTKMAVWSATKGLVKPATLTNWVKNTEVNKTVCIFLALCDYLKIEKISQAKVVFDPFICNLLKITNENTLKTPTK